TNRLNPNGLLILFFLLATGQRPKHSNERNNRSYSHDSPRKQAGHPTRRTFGCGDSGFGVFAFISTNRPFSCARRRNAKNPQHGGTEEAEAERLKFQAPPVPPFLRVEAFFLADYS